MADKPAARNTQAQQLSIIGNMPAQCDADFYTKSCKGWRPLNYTGGILWSHIATGIRYA